MENICRNSRWCTHVQWVHIKMPGAAGVDVGMGQLQGRGRTLPGKESDWHGIHGVKFKESKLLRSDEVIYTTLHSVTFILSFWLS